MIDFSHFLTAISHSKLSPWLQDFTRITEQLAPQQHGDFERWNGALNSLPGVSISNVELDRSTVVAGSSADCDASTQQQIEHGLRQLHPWRKGPFDVCGIHINTEWRSDWKWDRLASHIQPLEQRTVLDIGCGSGYHLWRMLGAGASMAIGIDPSWLFYLQFQAIQHFVGQRNAFHLPIGIEHMPSEMRQFDTVFSMGVLYHRRSPFDHLIECRDLLRPGGELVLETLVIDGEQGQVLVPQGRYARMGNVWFLPSVDTLLQWLEKVRFKNPRCVDVTVTTIEEQRSTDWMQFQSLTDFLDQTDQSKTLEGYPAPKRAIILAQA